MDNTWSEILWPWMLSSVLLLAVGFLVIFLSIVILLVYLRHANNRADTWPASVSLEGKTVVITTNGKDLGIEAARQIVSRGGKVILGCSDQKKVQEATDGQDISHRFSSVVWSHLDTSSLASVNAFADHLIKRETRIDVLVLAACSGGTDNRSVTSDGLERTMATNHFGHFLLMNRLVGLVRKHNSGRVIVLASSAFYILSSVNPKDLSFERTKYGGLRAFAQSMLCNILMANCLADITAGTGVTVNSFCPGMVTSVPYIQGTSLKTRLYHLLLRFVTRNDCAAARTIVYLAGSDEVANVTGGFFVNCEERKITGPAGDKGLARKVWEKSETNVHLAPPECSVNTPAELL